MSLLLADRNIKIAQADMTVFKVVRSQSKLITRQVEVVTPYQMTPVAAGETARAALVIEENDADNRLAGAREDGFDLYKYKTELGIHTFSYLTDATLEVQSWDEYRKFMIGMPEFFVVECVIPKDTPYVEGVFKVTYRDDKAKGALGHKRTHSTVFAPSFASNQLRYPAKLR